MWQQSGRHRLQEDVEAGCCWLDGPHHSFDFSGGQAEAGLQRILGCLGASHRTCPESLYHWKASATTWELETQTPLGSMFVCSDSEGANWPGHHCLGGTCICCSCAVYNCSVDAGICQQGMCRIWHLASEQVSHACDERGQRYLNKW